MPHALRALALPPSAEPASRARIWPTEYEQLPLTAAEFDVASSVWTIAEGRPQTLCLTIVVVAELARRDASTVRKALRSLQALGVLKLGDKHRGTVLAKVFEPDRPLVAQRARLAELDRQLDLFEDAVEETPPQQGGQNAPHSQAAYFGNEPGRSHAALAPPAGQPHAEDDDAPSLETAREALVQFREVLTARSATLDDDAGTPRALDVKTSKTSVHQTSIQRAGPTSHVAHEQTARERSPPHRYYAQLEPLWGKPSDHPAVIAYAKQLRAHIQSRGDPKIAFGPCLEAAILITEVPSMREAIEGCLAWNDRNRLRGPAYGKNFIAWLKTRVETDLGRKWGENRPRTYHRRT